MPIKNESNSDEKKTRFFAQFGDTSIEQLQLVIDFCNQNDIYIETFERPFDKKLSF